MIMGKAFMIGSVIFAEVKKLRKNKKNRVELQGKFGELLHLNNS
jgi:hypothetical protein